MLHERVPLVLTSGSVWHDKYAFQQFGIVTVIICFPTYMLIASLNTHWGLQFWTRKTTKIWARTRHSFAGFLAFFGHKPNWTSSYHAPSNSQPSTCFYSNRFIIRSYADFDDVAADANSPSQRKIRSRSASDAIAARGGFGPLSPGRAPLPSFSAVPNLDRQTSLNLSPDGHVKLSSTLSDTPRNAIGTVDPPIIILPDGSTTATNLVTEVAGPSQAKQPASQ